MHTKEMFVQRPSCPRPHPTRARFILLALLALQLLFAAACDDDSSGSSGAEYTGGTSGSTSGSTSGTTSGGTSGGGWSDTGGWSSSGSDASSWGNDTSGTTSGAWDSSSGADAGSNPGTNISFGGSQDFGYFRHLVANGTVPNVGDFDAEGFFAEHHTPLPPPTCGQRVCLQAMLGAMSNIIDGSPCTMLQVGLNSPLTVTPDQRPPLTLSVVVDVSGSMDVDNKLAFVREGLNQLIDGLNDTDQISIITYSTAAQVDFPMQPVLGNRVALRQIVTNLRAGGGTNIHAGLDLGYREALDHYDSGRQHRLILLSDGQPTAGPTDPASILSLSRSFNSEGVGLTSVGLGTDFNFTLMRDLALQGDGNFYFVEDSSAVTEVFTEELAYFTLPVAFDIELTLTAGPHYRFTRASGSPFWEPTDTGGALSIPSVFLAHRVSHDDTTPDGGRRGGGSALLIEFMPSSLNEDLALTHADVATIDLQFREPGTNAIVQESLTVPYPFNPWALRDQGFFDNDIVTKSFVMLNIYVGIEQACRLFHQNQGDDRARARAMLERLRAAVIDYNEELYDGEGDTDMNYNIALLDDLIALMIRLNAPPPPPNNIPQNPWPAD